MKFHCDRCKTRYSIADDRVRGKILKIRCKNCSAVITVREERRGAASGGLATDVVPPWFMAVSGIQHGPMPLADAMAWVAQRDRAEVIYCWTDGFDSWRPATEVEYFADLREPPSPDDEPNFEGETAVAPPTYQDGDGAAGRGDPPRADVPDSAAETEPAAAAGQPPQESSQAPAAEPVEEPAAASSQAEANEPVEAAEPSRPEPSAAAMGAPAAFPEPAAAAAPEPEAGASLTFEFEEASRVVDLNALRAAALGGNGADAPAAPATPAAPRMPTQPGVAAGGTQPEIWPVEPQPAPLLRRGRSAVLLAIGGVVVAGVAMAALFVRCGSAEDNPGEVARSAMPKEHLGYRVEIEPVEPDDPDPDPEAGEAEAEREGTGGGSRSRGGGRAPSTERGSSSRGARRDTSSGEGRTTSSALTGGRRDEVDLGERGDRGNGSRPLTPDDLLETYRRHRVLTTRCYNRALGRDPELDVRSARVTVTVAPTGRVSSVSIPSLAGTSLGTCLESRIRGWKFRASPEDFTGEFRMIFGR